MITGETNLPTAAELLAEAIVLARGLTTGPHDLARAKLLLELAHELRIGSRRVNPNAADRERLAAADIPVDYAGETAGARVQRVVSEAEERWAAEVGVPPKVEIDDQTAASLHDLQTALYTKWPARYSAVDDTLIPGVYGDTTPTETIKIEAVKQADELGVGTSASCKHCGEHIVFARPSTDHPAPMWYHNLTIQAVCPHAPDRNIASDTYAVHTFAEPLISTMRSAH